MLKLKERDEQATCPVTIDSGRIRWFELREKRFSEKMGVLDSDLQYGLFWM